MTESITKKRGEGIAVEQQRKDDVNHNNNNNNTNEEQHPFDEEDSSFTNSSIGFGNGYGYGCDRHRDIYNQFVGGPSTNQKTNKSSSSNSNTITNEWQQRQHQRLHWWRNKEKKNIIPITKQQSNSNSTNTADVFAGIVDSENDTLFDGIE